MKPNRSSRIYFGLLILVVAFASVSFVKMNNSSKTAPGNNYMPLPLGKQTQLNNVAREPRILYHRPSGGDSLASAADYPDYFERHPELSNRAVLGQGASDYYERHPELSAKAASSGDQSDYYFRHPELSASSAQQSVDLTDYYFRHINNK